MDFVLVWNIIFHFSRGNLSNGGQSLTRSACTECKQQMRFTRHEQHLARRGNSVLCMVGIPLVPGNWNGTSWRGHACFLQSSNMGERGIWLEEGGRKLYKHRNNIILRTITASGLCVQANSQEVSQEMEGNTKLHPSWSISGQQFRKSKTK